MENAYMDSNKTLTVTEPKSTGAITPWVEGSVFETLSMLSTKFASSQLVPKHFQGKTHDCFIALQMAHRMQVDPFLVLQNLNILHGRPAWAATFAISMANERGPFAGKIKFRTEGEGPSLKVTAFAKLKDGDDASATVSLEMARKEGWTKNPKYETMPEQMLCYRSAMFLIRRYCPEILNGMPSSDEIEDLSAAGGERIINGEQAPAAPKESKVGKLNKRLRDAAKNEQVIEHQSGDTPAGETTPSNNEII